MDIQLVSDRLQTLKDYIDFEHIKETYAALNQKTHDVSFWSDLEQAQKILKEKDGLNLAIEQISAFETRIDDAKTLYDLGVQMRDEGAKQESEALSHEIYNDICAYELSLMLKDPIDQSGAFLDINSGAGGTEAQDWGEMLLRLYMRFCERRKWRCEIIDETPGERAGIKSVTLKIDASSAYGWLKKETGVHRLVRISPFDANKRRHTSFASVSLLPILSDEIVVDVAEKDLRIDTYRASGAGGQHVNKTDSAIRITHIPTGIVVQCQTDRSQHRNRAYAMSMLKAKLYTREKEKRDLEHTVEKSDIAWGHQIRSYVLHPYQMVKDTRTGVEVGNTQSVLDGDINVFLEAALLKKDI